MKRMSVVVVLLALLAVAAWGQTTRFEVISIGGQFSDVSNGGLCLCYHGTLNLAWTQAGGDQGWSLGGTFFADARCTGAGCPFLLCPCGELTAVAGNSLMYEIPFLAVGATSFQGMLTVTVSRPRSGQEPVVESVALTM